MTVFLESSCAKETGFLTEIEGFGPIFWLKTRFLDTRA